MTDQDRLPDAAAPVPAVAVLLTQVATAEALAAAAALAKVPLDAVATPIGAVGVCREVAPGGPEAAAAALSRLLPAVPVILLVHRDGQVAAARWQGGADAGELAPALVLDGVPATVEDLILGQVAIGDLEHVSSRMSRWKASRLLAKQARRARTAGS